MPNTNAATKQIYIINQNDVFFLRVFLNPKKLSAFLQIDKRKLKKIGIYLLKLKLVNAEGDYQYYNIQLNITKNNSKIISASIVSID